MKTSLYSRIVRRIKTEVRQISKTPIKYRYKDFSINLPADHLLPTHQKNHPKYDRFLPHIAKYIDRSGTIIDIGANVGDTLAGMVEQNTAAGYICIEADGSFYRLLEENIKRIKSSKSALKVQAIKALVGKTISSASLEGKGGTKHAVFDETGSIKSMPLDEIIANVAHTDIRLLKSDVDGFDYDVLDSSMSVIQKHGPILFFELQHDHEYQKNGYAKTLSSLESTGYRDWTIFDNFGEVVIRTNKVGTIIQLMNYIWKQNIGHATRTIYYFDVLAVQEKDSNLIDTVLEEYDKFNPIISSTLLTAS
jgi:FkbM family methyltransferase